jgi:hypothetical protein
MSEAQKCKNCGADPLVPKVDDGTCSACGVDPFLVDIVGEKRALARALESHLNDMHQFVEELARMLENGFAEHTEIIKSGLFSKHISEIKVTLNQHVYHLKIHGKHAEGMRSRAVRGIKLKEEKLAMDTWLEELSNDLSAVAGENKQAKDALEKFIR